jgi:tetratricopeptide (TPR) repeat protein
MQLTIDQAVALAHQHQTSGRVADAETIYHHILAADARRPEALYRLGLILLDRSDPAGLDLVRRAIAVKPDYAEAHMCLGNELQKKGRVDEAIACYQRAILFNGDYAEAYNNLAAMLQSQGRIDDAVAAYRRAVTLRPDYFDALANLANLLQGLDRPREAIPLVRRAVELRPDFAPAHAHLANALRLDGALIEAAEQCNMALKLDPRCALAHQTMGGIHFDAERFEEALESYKHTLELAPDAIDALVNSGLTLGRLGRHEEAHATLRRAVELSPRDSAAHFNLGNALEAMDRIPEALIEYRTAAALKPNDYQRQNNLGMSLFLLGQFDEAAVALEKATALDPARTEARFNLALNQLITGNFRDGWKNYEVRWCQPAFIKQKCNLNKPQWDGRPPAPGAGNTLLICPEQGLGDMIQFVRFAPRAMQAGWKVILEVQSPLRALFESARPKLADQFVTWPAPADKEFQGVDTLIHVGSMPMVLDIDPTAPDFDARPYLQADPDRRAIWRERIGPATGPRVGLVWAGSPRHPMDNFRSIPLSAFAPLSRCGASLFSLQLGPAAQQLLQPPPGLQITDLSDKIETFADTAAILAELDLLITIDSAPAHLAGAMGRPCWLLLMQVPDFRWLMNRPDTPWYPSLRLYRQTQRHQWGPVIDRVASDLSKLSTQMRGPA